MKTRRRQNISLMLCVALIACISQAAGTKVANSDLNCAKYDSKGKCVECNDRFYFNTDTGLCTEVSEFCDTWDNVNGECVTCFPGYGIPITGVCSNVPVE